MITINLDKAKAITHEQRRNARAAEFAPIDEKIAKRIPGFAEAELEADRQAIRDRYADLQNRIDAAADPEALKPIMADLQSILTTAQPGA